VKGISLSEIGLPMYVPCSLKLKRAQYFVHGVSNGSENQ
jgi:hypothetical protein